MMDVFPGSRREALASSKLPDETQEVSEVEKVLMHLVMAGRIHPLYFTTEPQMHEEVARLLVRLKLVFEWEKVLGPGVRLDFFLPASAVAIECKVEPKRGEVLRQIKRYAERPEVKAVVLMCRRPIDLPETLSGKRVQCVALWRGGLL